MIVKSDGTHKYTQLSMSGQYDKLLTPDFVVWGVVSRLILRHTNFIEGIAHRTIYCDCLGIVFYRGLCPIPTAIAATYVHGILQSGLLAAHKINRGKRADDLARPPANVKHATGK